MTRLSLFERLLHRLHLLPTPIMDAFGNVLFGRALAIAVRRGLFEALDASPRSSSDLARVMRLNRAALELVLQSFVVAGYLRTSGDEYMLTGESRRWLVKASPSHLGHLIRYFETLYTRWDYLEHSLEQGVPPRPYFDGFTGEDWQVYVYGMRDLAHLFIPHVLKKINPGRSPQRLLDLGGSHGLYSIECCKRYPLMTATIMDLPGAVHHAQHFIEDEGMTERIHLLSADFTHADLPSSQDCVFMFNVIHGFNEDTNRQVIRRSLQALKAGGRIYILDQFREGRGALSQFMPLMVGLNLLNEIGGTTYSYAQVTSWCTDASGMRRLPLPFPGVALVEVTR